MKLAVTCLFLVLAVVYTLARPDDRYTDKFDNIDVDGIIKSDRLLRNYVNCLLEKGRCSPDAVELKRVLSDALETECGKCTEKQKEGARKVIKHLINNKPDMWKALTDKYDPDHKYRTKYEEDAKKEGVKL